VVVVDNSQTGVVQDAVQCARTRPAAVFGEASVAHKLAYTRHSCVKLLLPSQYFSRGFAVALTIRLFGVAVELAMLFSRLARAAADAADGERPAFLVDSDKRSV
jgi:hypothetical protein